MARTYTNTTYAALLRTLQRGKITLDRDHHTSLATVMAVARAHRGDLVKRVETSQRTGQRINEISGVTLNRNGLTAMRDQITAAGDDIPAALLDALEATRPSRPAPALRPITRVLEHTPF